MDCDMTAAINEPITTMSLSPNLFFPQWFVSVEPQKSHPHLWLTALAEAVVTLCASSPFPSSEFSTSHQPLPPLLQYPAAKPLGLKIELINTLVSTNEMTVSWWTVYLLDQLSRRVSGNVKREGNQYYNVLPVSSENGLDDRENLSSPHKVWFWVRTPMCGHLWVLFIIVVKTTSWAHLQPQDTPDIRYRTWNQTGHTP